MENEIEEVRRMVRESTPLPTVGRIVHVVDESGRHIAAMVVRESPLRFRLFPSDSSPLESIANDGTDFFMSCAEDQEAKSPMTWHWPERE